MESISFITSHVSQPIIPPPPSPIIRSCYTLVLITLYITTIPLSCDLSNNAMTTVSVMTGSPFGNTPFIIFIIAEESFRLSGLV